MVASHGIEGAPRAPPVSPKPVNASEEFLGQRDDDARRAPHVAESVLVLVLGHLADEFGAVGAQASDSVVDAFDCKHDAPEAQRVRRCDRRFDLDQFWVAKLRQLKPPVPIWGPHHNDVDLNTFEPVDAVHPRAFERHAERGEKSDSGCKVVDDDADVVQSLDRHVPSIAAAESDWSDLRFSGHKSPSAKAAAILNSNTRKKCISAWKQADGQD